MCFFFWTPLLPYAHTGGKDAVNFCAGTSASKLGTAANTADELGVSSRGKYSSSVAIRALSMTIASACSTTARKFRDELHSSFRRICEESPPVPSRPSAGARAARQQHKSTPTDVRQCTHSVRGACDQDILLLSPRYQRGLRAPLLLLLLRPLSKPRKKHAHHPRTKMAAHLILYAQSSYARMIPSARRLSSWRL